MQRFRSHTIRWTISLMLVLGLAAYISLPYSTKAQKAAFAEWLDRNVANTDKQSESTIRFQIKQLPFQNDTFPHLLKEASHLVLNFQHDFKLPLKGGEQGEESMSLWLVELWSKDQKKTDRMDLILPETIKTGLKWLSQNNFWTNAILPVVRELQTKLSKVTGRLLFVPQVQPIPFLSGISINAP